MDKAELRRNWFKEEGKCVRLLKQQIRELNRVCKISRKGLYGFEPKEKFGPFEKLFRTASYKKSLKAWKTVKKTVWNLQK